MTSSFIPFPEQEKCIKDSIQLLTYGGYNTIFNKAIMGSGKTGVTMMTAKRMGAKLGIICPKLVVNVWIESMNKFKEFAGLIEFVESYETFKSTRTPRYVTLDNGRVIANESLQKLIRKKDMIFVLDEVQKAKNEGTDTAQSLFALTELLQDEGRGKVIILSGTPMDFKRCSVAMLKYLDTYQSRDIVTYRPLELKGIYEVIEFLRDIIGVDKKIINELMVRLKGIKKKEQIIDISYDILSNYVLPKVSVFIDVKFKMRIEKKFFKLTDSEYKEYMELVEDIQNSDPFGSGKYSMTTCLRVAEEWKSTKIFVRVCDELLKQKKNSKCVLGFSFTDSIDLAFKMLSGMGYAPLVISGEVKSEKTRTSYIKMFQEQNLKYRIMILQTDSGGAGISLDDTTGDYPRFMLLSPSSMKYLNILQSMFRIARITTKSLPEVYIVYGYGVKNRQENISNIKKILLSDLTLKMKSLGFTNQTLEDRIDKIFLTSDTLDEEKKKIISLLNDGEYSMQDALKVRIILDDEMIVKELKVMQNWYDKNKILDDILRYEGLTTYINDMKETIEK